MSQSIFCLNPPKTFNKRTSLLPSSAFPSSSSSSSSSSSLSTRMTTKYPMCPLEIVSCQQQPSLEILTRGGYRGEVLNSIRRALPNCLSETHLHETVPGLKSKTRGKVRDIYDAGDYLVLVATDRQSAFDRVLASIPFKGEVLNETSLWWFDRTQHITPNAVVSAPDKNVTIAKKCSVFLVEFVGGL